MHIRTWLSFILITTKALSFGLLINNVNSYFDHHINSSVNKKNDDNVEDIKHYLIILMDEWLKISKIINNEQRFIELDNNTKNLIFLKNLIELNEKITMNKNELTTCGYNLSWYNNYGFVDLYDISKSLFEKHNDNCIMKHYNDSFFFNENSKVMNNNIVENQLRLILQYYNQYNNDVYKYSNYINNSSLIKSKLLNDENLYLEKNYYRNKKWNLSDDEINSEKDFYLNKIINKNPKSDNSWIDINNHYFKYVFKRDILEYLKDAIIKINNIIEITRKKMYSKVLYFYIWLIILSKVVLYTLRKIASLYIFFDKFIIYIIDTIEDYLFMLISLRFTFDLICTVINEV